MADLAQQLFAVGQLVGHNGANFRYQGEGGYHGQGPGTRQPAQQGQMGGLANAAGLLGSTMAPASDTGHMANGALVSGDISNAQYSNNYSLTGAAEADNTQYGLMGQEKTGLGADLQYKPQSAVDNNPFAIQNTKGLEYQQPSGFSTFFN